MTMSLPVYSSVVTAIAVNLDEHQAGVPGGLRHPELGVGAASPPRQQLGPEDLHGGQSLMNDAPQCGTLAWVM